MIQITPAAHQKLNELIVAHPADPVVRLTVKNRDDGHLLFRIVLVSIPGEEDEVQDYNGLTVAIEAKSARRMDGVTLDYQEPGGFKFHHPEPKDPGIRLIPLN
jgi:Fe-S cluster assembly iron-binding protein IscA